MMTTTYSHHAGGIHPGMAHGQPMGPAPGQNPGQPIGQPMQMHPGVSGPNGPHVTQAGAMMGMQPGVGGVGGPIQGQPSAHAMAHLGPQQAQAHLYQQHQQQMQQAMAANPALAQRQQFLRQQQQQQHLLQQQQQQNAMMFQGGMNPAMSGAPQMQAMMSANPQMVPGLPPHMRQQLAAQQQMHQQQQAAQAHQQQAQAQAQAQQQQQAQAQQAQQQQAAQAQQQQQAQAQQAQQQQAQAAQAQAAQAQAQQAQAAQAQAAQAQAQQQQQAQAQQAQAQQAQAAQAQQAQQQAQQLQQHLAMQHASSQQSNQGQGSAAAGPQQGPTRPPSQMGGANQAQASPAAQPTPQPTESVQPSAQQTAQQSAQPAQQAQNQAQAQNAAQAGQPTAAQQAQQAQQAQAAGLSVQQMQLLRRQQQAQQAQQAQRMKGAMILQLLQFSDHLSRFSCANTKQNSLAHWQNFVQRFFAEDGSFKQTVKDITDPSSKPKQFEICYTALPRYYWTQYASGVENIQVSLDGANEKDLPNTGHIVECARAKFIYWFRNGTQLVCTGRLVAVFGQGEKMDTLSFETQDHQQYLPRGNIERLFAQDSPNQKLSPRLSKTSAKQRNQQRNQPPADPTITLSDLPEPPVGGWGITNRILSYLETGETISYMQDLIVHYHSNPGKTSSEALSDLISTYPTFNPQQLTQQQLAHAQQLGLTNNAAMMQQQQQIQPGARTPSGTGGAAATPGAQGPFMSPHLANLGLPNAMNGSPHLSMQTHTPSPGQAHSLVHTHSQQGTNSSVASANTSPNVSNKRRRPSAVKVEGDDGGGGDVNGSGVTQKVKQSPRGNQNKRVKANAS